MPKDILPHKVYAPSKLRKVRDVFIGSPDIIYKCTQWSQKPNLRQSWTLDQFVWHHLVMTHRAEVFRHVCVSLVLWHCWLGGRKSVWPVKIEWCSVGVVISLEWGADCLHMVQLMPLHPKTPSSLASSKLVLPFCNRLTQVVLEKRLLNGCSSSLCA